MSADAVALRTLGLEPGADWPAVERAYRTLIKRHHPDRQGGDAARAAEINWAYHQLRNARSKPVAPSRPANALVPLRQPSPARRGRGWVMIILFAGIAAAVVLQEPRFDSPLDDRGLAIADWNRPMPADSRPQPAAGFEAGAAGPLDQDAVDRSVIAASRLAREGGAARLARQSRRCHAELHSKPAMSRFDQCIAFDEAAAALLGQAPSDAAGQFDPSAITGRQIAAARRVSDDYMAMDSRVARIRSQVAFALAPPDPQPAPVKF